MSNYSINKAKAKTKNTDPTMTDQAGANDTDINVIVRRFTGTGQLPQSRQQPMYIDTTQLPTGLRDFIETARTLDNARANLPSALKDMPTDEILGLTPDKLKDILTPPAPPPAPTPPPAAGET